MKIGIDGTPLTIPFSCGQKTYLKNLIDHLAYIDKQNHYYIFTAEQIPAPKSPNFHLILIPHLPVLKRQLLIPLMAKYYKVDIFHYPDVIGSVFVKPAKTIITYHDSAPMSSYPEFLKSPKYYFFYKYNSLIKSITLRQCSSIITVSQTICDEIKALRSGNIHIHTVPEGVNSGFSNLKIKKGNYFLAMADFSPRKNIIATLEAFQKFIKSSDRKFLLRIIISTGYPRKGILKKISKLNISDKVQILENIPDRQLINIYNQAVCFLYPSFYEGFGLPILEAMACGCPVITSNYGAMREVAGDSAYLVNPYSVEEISTAMENIVKDKRLRLSLIIKGLKRAKIFTWEKTARATLKVYQECYKNP